MNLSWRTTPSAINMGPLKTGGLWVQVQFHSNVGPAARNLWPFKTGGPSWQWPRKPDFTVPHIKSSRHITKVCQTFVVVMQPRMWTNCNLLFSANSLNSWVYTTLVGKYWKIVACINMYTGSTCHPTRYFCAAKLNRLAQVHTHHTANPSY